MRKDQNSSTVFGRNQKKTFRPSKRRVEHGQSPPDHGAYVNTVIEYLHMVKVVANWPSDVTLRHVICSVKRVYYHRLNQVKYPILVVIRQDAKEWVFSEADFHNLEIDDF